jgi:hypothetical protein
VKIDTILRQTAQLWFVMGTVMWVITAFRGFQETLVYVLALIIVWMMIIGLPCFVLYTTSKWVKRRYTPTTPVEEEKEKKP